MKIDAADAGQKLFLSRMSEMVEAELGLFFPPERWGDLARGLDEAARDLGLDGASSWKTLPTPGAEEIQALASRLVVGETYFFRDRKCFDALYEKIFPDLISRRRAEKRLTIWSAGCATGEEAYSIAIVLDRILPRGKPDDWQVTIHATDVNRVFLEKAAGGIYGMWSFRDAPGWLRDGYFKAAGDRWEIEPRIKERVRFSFLNLGREPYPLFQPGCPRADLIMCRNVMMYLSRPKTGMIADHFSECLADDGWLIVSPGDLGAKFFSRFSSAGVKDVPAYKKAGRVEIARRPSVDLPPPPAAQREIDTLRPDGSRTLLHFARAMADGGKHDAALAVCDLLTSEERLNPAFHFLRAGILHERENFAGAEETLKRLLYLEPDYPLAHFLLGTIARRVGKKSEARRHLRNALRVLGKMDREALVSGSEGMTAGALFDIAADLLRREGEE